MMSTLGSISASWTRAQSLTPRRIFYAAVHSSFRAPWLHAFCVRSSTSRRWIWCAATMITAVQFCGSPAGTCESPSGNRSGCPGRRPSRHWPPWPLVYLTVGALLLWTLFDILVAPWLRPLRAHGLRRCGSAVLRCWRAVDCTSRTRVGPARSFARHMHCCCDGADVAVPGEVLELGIRGPVRRRRVPVVDRIDIMAPPMLPPLHPRPPIGAQNVRAAGSRAPCTGPLSARGARHIPAAPSPHEPHAPWLPAVAHNLVVRVVPRGRLEIVRHGQRQLLVLTHLGVASSAGSASDICSIGLTRGSWGKSARPRIWRRPRRSRASRRPRPRRRWPARRPPPTANRRRR